MNSSNKIFFSVTPRSSRRSITKHYKNTYHKKGSKSVSKSNTSTTVSDLSARTHNGLKILNLPLSYPRDAIRKKLTGVVIVKVSFEDSGKIKTKEIIQSSGHQILDRTVLIALDRGKLKQKNEKTPESMTLSFNFRL